MKFSDLDFLCFICGRTGRRGFVQSSGKDGATGTHTCKNRKACRERELAKMAADPAWNEAAEEAGEQTKRIVSDLTVQYERTLRQKQSVIDNDEALMRWLKQEIGAEKWDALLERWRVERIEFYVKPASRDSASADEEAR